MTVCAEIEAAVCAALRARLGASASVAGLREAAAAGELKETAGGLPEVGVSVAPGRAGGYGSPVLEFSVSVRVSLMLEDDATQTAFDEVCAAVESLVLEWNLDREWRTMAAALTTARFRADGFRADGGADSSDFASDSPRLSTTYVFALTGVLTLEN